MLHPKDFIHPEDEAALRNLEAIPGFAQVLKLLMKWYHEKLVHGINMASKIRLSPTQLPEIYNLLPPICKRLSIAEPEFYLEMNPAPNAYAFGDTNTAVTVTSGLIQYLTTEEVESVIAHECGHIACRHMLYHSLAQIIIDKLDSMGLLGDLAMPVALAFYYWQRKSELSADRAGAIGVGSIERVVNTQIRLAGGPKEITGTTNIEEFVKQADYYDTLKQGTWDKLLQIQAVMYCSHPFAAVRVREILRWGNTDHYQRLVKGIEAYESTPKCQKCQNIVDPEWRFCKFCGTKLK